MTKITEIVLICLGLFIAFGFGVERTEKKYSQILSDDNLIVLSCDGGGCMIEIPEIDTIQASCEDGYNCTTIAKTQKQRDEDELFRKELEKVMDEATKIRETNWGDQ